MCASVHAKSARNDEEARSSTGLIGLPAGEGLSYLRLPRPTHSSCLCNMQQSKPDRKVWFGFVPLLFSRVLAKACETGVTLLVDAQPLYNRWPSG